MSFSKDLINIDAAAETERIVKMMRQTVGKEMNRRGGVIGISGGVDSSTVLALAVRAFGANKIRALLLPEKDSDTESEQIARRLAAQFGIEPVLESITPVLEGSAAYNRRDEAIKLMVPEYDPAAGYKAKIVLPGNLLEKQNLNVFYLVVVTPDGEEIRKRLKPQQYLQIVAASNFKQRTRMTMLYYHAELLNYAVIGTANKNEHGQGFFVKYGDGGVDIQPIIHLYKTQVYQIAEYLDVPEEIRQRTPTSDTYPAHQTQEEFFFRLPFETLDLLWYAWENDHSPADVAPVMGLTEEQVKTAYDDIARKIKTTEYLRMAPVYMDAPE